MSRFKLRADECKHDRTPRCPSDEVRLRVIFDDIFPGKERAVFDPVAVISRLNEICEACAQFEPKDN